MRIGALRWNGWNEEHIARHGVEPVEVEEVVASGTYYVVRARNGRYGLIGQTDGGRSLSIIVEREDGGSFFVVTARAADADERRLYARRRNRH